jgi:hypothetical protein
MTREIFHNEIAAMIPALLDMARLLTSRKIAAECLYILSEIKESELNFHQQRVLRKKLNDKKVPVSLPQLLPVLYEKYGNLYDINLYIYRAYKHHTVIDIRYYPKSSLDIAQQKIVVHNPPMLHCKVAQPPWLIEEKAKFDINWEHRPFLIHWNLFWARQRVGWQVFSRRFRR